MLTAAPHPRADKLQVLTVDAGTGEAVQVVCGAPNARAGMKGVFAAPGTYVPGAGLTLGVAAIRGVESRGMMCSIRELELGDEHEGIVELAADAPVGAGFAEHAGLDDPVIDVAVTPNRPDAMGVHGIARDLAAAGLGRLRPLAVAAVAGAFPCPIEIRTDDPEGCPAFYGRVIRGVKNGGAPEAEVHYIEASVDLSRRDDRGFPWERLDPAKKLLYASLGSQSFLAAREAAVSFLRAVAEGAARRPDWQLVLGTGGLVEPADLPLPAGAVTLPWIPQIPILERAALMVTHGGLGTIKECIFHDVPMVVFPIGRDQPETVWQPLTHAGASDSSLEQTVRQYADALKAWRTGDYDGCIALLLQLLDQDLYASGQILAEASARDSAITFFALLR